MTEILLWNPVCITSHAWMPQQKVQQDSTIMGVMNRALKMKKPLKLSWIVCVFDQSVFTKKAEIKWRDPSKYKLFSTVRYIACDNDVHECHKQEI